MNKIAHSIQINVYTEDTDAGGVVFHPNYLKFCDRARCEMIKQIRDGSFSVKSLSKDLGIFFAVASAELKFISPAIMDDVLTIETLILGVGAASFKCLHNIFSTNSNESKKLLANATIKLCTVVKQDSKLIPTPIPKPIVDFFKEYCV